MDGIFKGSPKNDDLRKMLKSQADEYGNRYLYDKLKVEDPKAASKIHPNDLRRVIRALEVCLSDQKQISELQGNREGLWGKYDIRAFALNADREQLYNRINERVDEMFEKGLVDEIKNVIQLSQTSDRIIGVREVQGFLRNEYDLDQAKELIKQNTRQFAKRQLTWFRKEKRLQWMMVTSSDTSEKIAARILKEIGALSNAKGPLKSEDITGERI